MRIRLIALAAALAVSSCGIPLDDDPQVVALPEGFDLEPTTTTSTTAPQVADGQRIYFIRDGQLVPRTRELAEDALAQEVFEQLLLGPSEIERELSIESRLGPDLVLEAGFLTGTRILQLNFVSEADEESPFLGVEGELRSQALAQLVFTGMVYGASGVVFAENAAWQLVANDQGEVQVFGDDGVPVPLTTLDFLAFSPGG